MILERQTAPPQPPTFKLDRVSQFQTPEEEMQMLGISSQYEFERYQKVSEIAGHGVALAEIERNKRAYEREFLEDIPVAESHTYFHRNGELYSEPNDHELFRVASQIDPRERKGRTLMGFNHFQKQIMQAQDGEVILWYSPAGKAGSEGPFSKIHFDSGRLYLAFKDNNGQSTHIDIKINEEHFPIRELLFKYRNCSLDHPVRTQMDTENLIASLYDFAQINGPDKIVYTSQRDSKNPTHHTLMQIIDEVTNQISLYQQLPDIPKYPHSIQQTSDITRQGIQDMYVQAIQSHIDHNGGEARLYGCSTTSVITAAQEVGKSTGFAGLGSPFSSFARIMNSGSSIVEANRGCGVQGCALNKMHFHCPGEKNGRPCNHAISGTNECSECGLTSKQWAEQTGQKECA